MRFAIALLAVGALVQPALSAAGDQSTGSGTKPSSYVPHAHAKSHVYGAPIQPAIVGRAKHSHHKHAPNR